MSDAWRFVKTIEQVAALATVNPQGLGMSRVLSEDAVRRAFAGEEAGPLESWQREHLWRSVEPVLKEPWICDIDVTVKTIYGRQEGAEVGYNPHKPGRPAHAYHTFFISRLRLALDVVVVPGKQFHSRAVSQTLLGCWEKLSPQHRPCLLRGDCGFGNENFMEECEKLHRQQRYLFRLRDSRGVAAFLGNRNRRCLGAKRLVVARPVCACQGRAPVSRCLHLDSARRAWGLCL